jgi:hypothetical protein
MTASRTIQCMSLTNVQRFTLRKNEHEDSRSERQRRDDPINVRARVRAGMYSATHCPRNRSCPSESPTPRKMRRADLRPHPRRGLLRWRRRRSNAPTTRPPLRNGRGAGEAATLRDAPRPPTPPTRHPRPGRCADAAANEGAGAGGADSTGAAPADSSILLLLLLLLLPPPPPQRPGRRRDDGTSRRGARFGARPPSTAATEDDDDDDKGAHGDDDGAKRGSSRAPPPARGLGLDMTVPPRPWGRAPGRQRRCGSPQTTTAGHPSVRDGSWPSGESPIGEKQRDLPRCRTGGCPRKSSAGLRVCWAFGGPCPCTCCGECAGTSLDPT